MLAAPKPTPKPTVTPTKAPAADTTAAAGDGFHLWSWLFHHPIAIPIILIVLWIGALYGWSQLRKYYLAKGRPVAPLGSIVRRVWRFAFKEDKAPVFGKIKPLAAKTTWLTGTRLYLILLALIPISAATHIIPTPLVLFILAVTLTARARPVFRARWGIQMQMFGVVAAECKYPRGAELNPWGYVNIQNWTNLTTPGQTVITYPPAYQSEDRNAREKFERNFNGTVSDENSWNYTWESTKNRVVCKPTDFLPSMANYPGPGSKWNEFVLGTTGEAQAVWDVSSFPHALVCGPTGSGKSVLQRMILFHALAHSDTWKIVGVDPKMVEMGWLKKYDNVLKIALTLEEGVEVVQSVRDEMMRRYDEMSELGYNHFLNLPQPPPALLCMVDETFNFLAIEGIKSDEGKERDNLHATASTLLGEIARLGRAAGIHLVLATQRPDATTLKGELKNNLDCRIAAGRMDTTPSLMVLDSEHATRLPKIKGRGVIRLGGEVETFQGYFAPQEWYDEWKAAQEAGPAMPEEAARAPEPASGKKRGFGFKGVAAKTAAAAERRSKSIDAPSETPETDSDSGLGDWAGDLDLDMGAPSSDEVDDANMSEHLGEDVGDDLDDFAEPGDALFEVESESVTVPVEDRPAPVASQPSVPQRPVPPVEVPPVATASAPVVAPVAPPAPAPRVPARATRPAGPPAPSSGGFSPDGPPPPPASSVPAGLPRQVAPALTPTAPGGPRFMPTGINPLTGQPIGASATVDEPEVAPEPVAPEPVAPPEDVPAAPRLPMQRPTGIPVQRPVGLPTRPPQA